MLTHNSTTTATPTNHARERAWPHSPRPTAPRWSRLYWRQPATKRTGCHDKAHASRTDSTVGLARAVTLQEPTSNCWLFCLLVWSSQSWYPLFPLPALFWHFRYFPGNYVWLALFPVQLALVFVLLSLRFNLPSLSFVLCCIGAFLNKQSSRPDLIVLWICCRPPNPLFQQHH